MSPSLIPKPVQIPSFMCGGTTVIELREFNDKKKKKKKNNIHKMQKLHFAQKMEIRLHYIGRQMYFATSKSLQANPQM